jgi:hypothetical protein
MLYEKSRHIKTNVACSFSYVEARKVDFIDIECGTVVIRG